MKSPKEIIADNLPTFADLYYPSVPAIPSFWRIEKAAEDILKALKDAGYKITWEDK
jgi:hypothetical protein